MKARGLYTIVGVLALVFIPFLRTLFLQTSLFEEKFDQYFLNNLKENVSEILESRYLASCLNHDFTHCCFYYLNENIPAIVNNSGIVDPTTYSDHRKDSLEFLLNSLEMKKIVEKSVDEALRDSGYDPSTASYTVSVESMKFGTIDQRIINHTTLRFSLECYFLKSCVGTKPSFGTAKKGATSYHRSYSLPEALPQDTLYQASYPRIKNIPFGIVRGLFPCIAGPPTLSEASWLARYGVPAITNDSFRNCLRTSNKAPICLSPYNGTARFDVTGYVDLFPGFNYTLKTMRGRHFATIEGLPLNKSCVDQMVNEIIQKVGIGNNSSYLLFRTTGVYGTKLGSGPPSYTDPFNGQILVNWTCNNATCLKNFATSMVPESGYPCVIQCSLKWSDYNTVTEILSSPAKSKKKKTLLLNDINVFSELVLNYGIHSVTTVKKLVKDIYRITVRINSPIQKTIIREVEITHELSQRPVMNFSGEGIANSDLESLTISLKDPILQEDKGSRFVLIGEGFHIDDSTTPTNNNVVDPYAKTVCWTG